MGQPIEALASIPGGVLGLAVEPVALERLVLQDRPDGVDSRPIHGMFDQILLDPMGEEIAEPAHLGRLFIADDDRRVAPGPESLEPLVEAAHLVSDLAIDVLHETGELLRVVHPEQGMPVRRHEDHTATAHAIALLSPAESADDDLVQGRARPQEEAGLPRPDGHFYLGAPLGYKAQTPGHAYIKDEKRPGNVISLMAKEQEKMRRGWSQKPTMKLRLDSSLAQVGL